MSSIMSTTTTLLESDLDHQPHLSTYSIRHIPLPLPQNTDFSLSNIPFGVFTPPHLRRTTPPPKHICTAIGDYILDLHELTNHGAFVEAIPSVAPHDEALWEKQPPSGDILKPPIHRPHPLLQRSLNTLAQWGRETMRGLRMKVREIVEIGGVAAGLGMPPEWPLGTVFRRGRANGANRASGGDGDGENDDDGPGSEQIVMHVPFEIGDYSDFYAGRHHAYNVGCLFRGPLNAIQPNYFHLPVGYHGRASTICISGNDVTRPMGQLAPLSSGARPRFGPTEKLDYELELAAFVGVGNGEEEDEDWGEGVAAEGVGGLPISVAKAANHIFGFVLMNDWSARDIQAWEYVPLGPFLGKSFATTISPWVVTMDALEPFRTEKEGQGVELLPYLAESSTKTIYDFTLEVHITPSPVPVTDSINDPTDPLVTPNPEKVPMAITSPRHLIWSFEQMLAHHSINGCKLRTGDLLGSGTISGPTAGEEGSLLEMSRNGTVDVYIGNGNKRRWLQDGDEVEFTGWGVLDTGERVGFGECTGRVVKALDFENVRRSKTSMSV